MELVQLRLHAIPSDAILVARFLGIPFPFSFADLRERQKVVGQLKHNLMRDDFLREQVASMPK